LSSCPATSATRTPSLHDALPIWKAENGLASGADSGPMVAVYGIPYLEPRMVAEELGVENGTHFSVTEAAVQLITADLATRPPGKIGRAHVCTPVTLRARMPSSAC